MKKTVFGILVLILTFVIFSCDSGSGTITGTDTGTDSDSELPAVFTSKVSGKTVEVTISRTDTLRSVITPTTNDYYVIRIDGVISSFGTIIVNNTQITFVPSSSSPCPGTQFIGTLSSNNVLTIQSFPNVGGGTLSGFNSNNQGSGTTSGGSSGTNTGSNPGTTPGGTFVPVTSISNVPLLGYVNVELTLTGTVNPTNSTNKTIVWSIKTDGGTNSTLVGNKLTSTMDGTVEVTATITNGLTSSSNYTQDFQIVIMFVPVTYISGIPNTGLTGSNITLSGTVFPSTATNKTIVWSITNDGGTSSSLSGNVLTPTSIGTVKVTATITNGLTSSSNYTQDFDIEILSSITQHTVTLIDPVNSNFTIHTDSYDYGTTFSLNNYSQYNNTGDSKTYTIKGWYTDSGLFTLYSGSTSFTVTSSLTLYAKVEEKQVGIETIYWGCFYPEGSMPHNDIIPSESRLWGIFNIDNLVAAIENPVMLPNRNPGPPTEQDYFTQLDIISPADKLQRLITYPDFYGEAFFITPKSYSIPVLKDTVFYNDLIGMGGIWTFYDRKINNIDYYIYKLTIRPLPGETNTYQLEFN